MNSEFLANLAVFRPRFYKSRSNKFNSHRFWSCGLTELCISCYYYYLLIRFIKFERYRC